MTDTLFTRLLGKSDLTIPALGWLWARSEVTIPIPGFKNVEQVTENVGALEYGPLRAAQMEEVAELLS